MLRGASRPLIGGLRTAAILRRASRPLIGGLRTAAILRRLQSFSSQAEMHLKNYKEKETTIMVVKLDDGDFLVGSDSRRTVAVGSDSFITCEVANKVNYLGRSVLLARAGSVLYLKRCVRDMLSASFSVVDRCLENVLKKGTQYVNWLNCDASLGFIVMGYVKGIGRMFLLAYFKNKDSSAVRMLEELSRFYCIGSGAEYLAEYVNPRLNELTCIDLKSILNLAEIGFLIASLKDRCTGGHITVRRFTPKGVEVVSQNTVLGLVKKYYGLLAPSYERSILVVFKMLVVEIFVDGEYNPCLVPDVDMELLKGVIGGEESLRAHDFGHPLASLCGDFYVQIVRFAEVDSVDCFMRMAHEVPDQEVLFAYRSCGVKEFVVGGKSVYVMAATRSNLENLKDCLPPIDPMVLLSYIFNNFTGGRTFSEVVAEAKQAGYTEPAPRDDLSGTDVCRKVIILAGESGLKLQLSDIPVESLVPEPLKDSASAEEFMQKLPQFDQEMSKERQTAEDAGGVLRFVGVVDMVNQKGEVKLQTYKNDHPFAQLSGADNIIAFTTTRYKAQPGAGAEITAGGVFSDLLRLA